MNSEHRALCASDRWAAQLRDALLPWALDRIPDAALLLELGPGPGAATTALRDRARRVVAVEFDAQLAAALPAASGNDPSVTVLRGDAARIPAGTGRVDAVAAFTMLHHLPDRATQDRAFAEVRRVLRPGGVFVGTDSLDSPGLRRLHHGDTLVPLDPLTLGARLDAAGLSDVEVVVRADGVRFAARA